MKHIQFRSAILVMVVAGLTQALSAREQVLMVDDRPPHTRSPDVASFDQSRSEGHYKCDDEDHGGGTRPEIPQWVREFGTTGNDYAGGVAVDPSGNALIVGGSNDFTDAFVRKYDSSGNVFGRANSQLASAAPGSSVQTDWGTFT